MSRKVVATPNRKKFLKLSAVARPVRRFRAQLRSKRMLVGVAAVVHDKQNTKIEKQSAKPSLSFKFPLGDFPHPQKISNDVLNTQEVKSSYHDARAKIESVLLARHHELFSSSLPECAVHHLVKRTAYQVSDQLGVPRNTFQATNMWLKTFLKQNKLLGYKSNAAKLNTVVNLQEVQDKCEIANSSCENSNGRSLEQQASATTPLNLFNSSVTSVSNPPTTAFSEQQAERRKLNLPSDGPNHLANEILRIPDSSALLSPRDDEAKSFKPLHSLFLPQSVPNLSQKEKRAASKKRWKTIALLCSKNDCLKLDNTLIPRHCCTPQKTGCVLLKAKHGGREDDASNINPCVNDDAYHELFDVTQHFFISDDEGVSCAEDADSGYRSRSESKRSDAEPMVTLQFIQRSESETLNSKEVSSIEKKDSRNLFPENAAETFRPVGLMNLFNTTSEIDSCETAAVEENDETMHQAETKLSSLMTLFNTQTETTNNDKTSVVVRDNEDLFDIDDLLEQNNRYSQYSEMTEVDDDWITSLFD